MDRVTFSSLGIGAELCRALEELAHQRPTPVQEATIPAILQGRDLWASAMTGSGKTAAFVLPILQTLAGLRRAVEHTIPLHGLLLVPTRELALQTAETIQRLGAHLRVPPKTCVAVGGLSINPQMLDLRGGADLVVATPGRLLDLLAHNALRLSPVKVLVLDEADRLLSLGFADELGRIRKALPTRCQTLLFSATMPPAVQSMAETLLHEALAINIDAGASPDVSAIVQRVIEVDENKRLGVLRHLLGQNDWPQVLVFVATKSGTQTVSRKLNAAGVAAAALHGELSQGTRTAALVAFKERTIRVLVATDLAARGLHVAALAAIVNYDLPRSAADYVHRIGRTGRAGLRGEAVTFVTAATDAHFRLIERRHRLSLTRERVPGFEPTDIAPPAGQTAGGGVKGKRKSKKDKLREAAALRARG